MCSKPELLKAASFMSEMICVRFPTQIPAEKEFQRADLLHPSHDPGAAGLKFSASLSDLYLPPKEAANRGECLQFKFQ